MKLKILWIITFDYESRTHSGAYLRYFNFAPELIRLGHEVRFLVFFTGNQCDEGRAYFRAMREEGTITDFEEWPPLLKEPLPFLARLTMHPPLEEKWFRKAAKPAIATVNRLIDVGSVNCLIIASAWAFPLLNVVRHRIPVVIDFCDVISLALRRELMNQMKQLAFTKVPRQLREIQYIWTKERYYGKRAHMNLVVSDVDQAALGRITGDPARTAVVLNGVKFSKRSPAAKLGNRLIFSGVMDFSPNVAAATWFCKEVFPKVLAKRPDTVVVLAGARPTPSIQALAQDSVLVTGFVDDMSQEIAKSALFVNPIVSGTGFRNKVLEAVASGTYVISTSRGVEFLPGFIREHIATCDNPAMMADKICELLNNPSVMEDGVRTLQRLIEQEFLWSVRAAQLAATLQRLHCIEAQ